MKWTNKLNLPQPLCDAVINDEYNMGNADISVTSLIGPARKRALEIQYKDQLEDDIANGIYRLLGKVVHGILEKSDSTGIVERRLFMKVEGLPGKIWVISGAMDRYVLKSGKLQDYKFTSCYKFIGDKVSEDFEQQLNIYVELLRQNNIDVQSAEIVGILRDWYKMKALRESDYPEYQTIIQQIPIWSREKVQNFIKERVIEHQKAEETLPLCTEAERWAKPTKYAVMKEGAKKAVKLYDTIEAAEIHASKNSAFYVECRPGESTRCENYCLAAKYCSQYMDLLKTKENE